MRRFILVLGLLLAALAGPATALASPVTVSSRVTVFGDFAGIAPQGTTGTITYEFDPMLPGTFDPDSGRYTVANAALSLTVVLGSLTLETSGVANLSWRDQTAPGSDCDVLFSQACRDIVFDGDSWGLGWLSLTEPVPVGPLIPPRPGFPPPGGYVATQISLSFSDPNDDPLAPPMMITDGVIPTDASLFQYGARIAFLDSENRPVGGVSFVPEPTPTLLVGTTAAIAAAMAARRRRLQPRGERSPRG